MNIQKYIQMNDQLILSLSHAPLPTPLLDLLLSETSKQCHGMLKTMSRIQQHYKKDGGYDEKKETSTSYNAQSENSSSFLHVLATGTPYVIMPGKAQPDYIHQWTKGEEILAGLVDKIGMHKFHRTPANGETKLTGRLISVKPSDFQFILRHKDEHQSNNSFEGIVAWSDDCLHEELTSIANNILRILIIDQRPSIGNATILFPLDPRFEDVEENKMIHFITQIFQKRWSSAHGPLHGANIKVMVIQL
jgi:hypothetical protein